MYLLKKDTFEFKKIIKSGYKIYENNNIISKKQLANGKRKKVSTSFEDVIISVDLAGINNNDIDNYINNLVDGTYEYYSFKYKTYKTANFIVTKPEIVVEKAYSTGDYYLDDYQFMLEKSSDVV